MIYTDGCSGCGWSSTRFGKEPPWEHTCPTCNGAGEVTTWHPGTTYTKNFGTVTINYVVNDDGTITLTANTPSGVQVTSYSWTGPVTGSTNSIIANKPGTYRLTVNLQSGGYTGSGTVTATIQ